MLQEVINIALNDAFIRFRNVANGSSSEFIRIPQIDGLLRLSEQEFKWLFIQRLICYMNNNTLSFSLEDPTINGYVFSTKDKDKKAFTFCKHNMKQYKQYRSANIDLSIYERGRRVAIMEFKAGNPGPFYHAKDFFKLAHEPDNVLRYFVEIYERTDSNTLENINGIRKVGAKSAENYSSMKTVNNSPTVVANVYLQGTAIRSETDLDLLATKVSDKLGEMIVDKGMEWG